jgi:cardiolipin synthase
VNAARPSHRGAAIVGVREAVAKIGPPKDLASESFVLTLDKEPAAIPEQLLLLDGGDEAYPRMLAALALATQSVHLETYAFEVSGVGARFVDALQQAAGRGVAVRVVIDGWGSARGGRAIATALRQAGCAVRIYNRLLSLLLFRFARNHRKILLVDE